MRRQDEMPKFRKTIVQAKIVSIIVDQLGIDEDEVTPEALIRDDLGADSLDVVELVMAFEEEFYLELPDDELQEVRTVTQAVAFISNRLALAGRLLDA